MKNRIVGTVLVLVGSVGLASTVGSTTVAAMPSAGSFSGTAGADGVRLSYEVKGFLLTDRLADGGGPVAQAAVSSLESVGFSSAPYPGDVVLSAPPLASGAIGAPVPDYPLVASSTYPAQPEQSVDQGAVRLKSASTASSSVASGAAGGPDDEAATMGATRASAEVVHDEADGTVTSTASSSAEAFSVAGVFRIGRVSSMATVVDRPDGDPERETSMVVGEMTIAGQTVSLTPKGLALSGSSTPLPDGSPLLEALAGAGIDVRYLAAEDSADGVVAPGVEVRLTHPIPNAPAPAVAVYRFGRASASATGGLGGLTTDGDLDGITDGITDAIDPSGGTGDGAFDAAGPPPGEGTAVTGVPSPAAAPSGSSEELQSRPVVAAAMPQWDQTWSRAFYLAIVFSGLVAVSGAQLIRLLGVRMPWS